MTLVRWDVCCVRISSKVVQDVLIAVPIVLFPSGRWCVCRLGWSHVYCKERKVSFWLCKNVAQIEQCVGQKEAGSHDDVS